MPSPPTPVFKAKSQFLYNSVLQLFSCLIVGAQSSPRNCIRKSASLRNKPRNESISTQMGEFGSGGSSLGTPRRSPRGTLYIRRPSVFLLSGESSFSLLLLLCCRRSRRVRRPSRDSNLLSLSPISSSSSLSLSLYRTPISRLSRFLVSDDWPFLSLSAALIFLVARLFLRRPRPRRRSSNLSLSSVVFCDFVETPSLLLLLLLLSRRSCGRRRSVIDLRSFCSSSFIR
mmetsp:Transcript_48961/g.54753  ORF Transcript_48961/g.54753 Transcript_48961/m.54753 type:complete len:229 (+) Transcript_48961:481-1167(+)